MRIGTKGPRRCRSWEYADKTRSKSSFTWPVQCTSPFDPKPFFAQDPDSALRLPVDIVVGKKALLERPAQLDPAIRAAIVAYCASLKGGAPAQVEVPAELRALLDKIATAAYKIMDEDIAALRERGYNDAKLFEVVVCAAAFGAALAPLETAYAVLQGKLVDNDFDAKTAEGSQASSIRVELTPPG